MPEVELASALAAGGSGKQADAIRQALYHTYYGAFYAIAALTGHEHWALEQNEAATLGELTDRALATYKKSRTVKKVMGYLPFLALGTTVIGIVGVRAQESYAQIRRRKVQQSIPDRGPDAGPRPGPRDIANAGLSGGGGEVAGSRNPSSTAGALIRSLTEQPIS